jgi:hypothetical protein
MHGNASFVQSRHTQRMDKQFLRAFVMRAAPQVNSTKERYYQEIAGYAATPPRYKPIDF